MHLSDDEFRILIQDPSKTIDGDIQWNTNENQWPRAEFRVDIISDPGYPLFLKGSYNGLIAKLTYAIIHRPIGRIYALDLGTAHKNPDGTQVGDTHKHRWQTLWRDKHAYEPPDITAPATDPILVWQQFCIEAAITHHGRMLPPPAPQLDLFLS